MDRLWAPWRIAYVNKRVKRKCIFCIEAKKINLRKNYIVETGRYSFVILNIFPYNNGHLMIVPYRHLPDVSILRTEEWNEMLKFIKIYKSYLSKILNPDGYNLGINIGRAAGAGFANHVHLHIVPRWIGDSNFMPAITKTKIISQSLDELYKQLKKWQKKK
ncbi:MAG: HIT domain-containing protein [Candidatus Omnitrophota bacterium]